MLFVVNFYFFTSAVLPKLLPFSFGDEPAYLAESTTVQCSISLGDLPVSFSWLLNGAPIRNEPGVNVVAVGKKTFVLSIDSLAENHAGNYTCLATNKAGTASHNAELIVNGNSCMFNSNFSSSTPDHPLCVSGRSHQFR